MSLSEKDHALIRRLVDRQPPIFLSGHEGYYQHDDIVEVIQLVGRLQAAREEASQGAGEPVADDVAVYNKRFDAADEAGQEIHAEAFWQGWMWARDPNFEDEEGMREEFNRGIDGVVLGEAWEACREAFFKRLPLAALDQPTSPPTDPRIKALEEALETARDALQAAYQRTGHADDLAAAHIADAALLRTLETSNV